MKEAVQYGVNLDVTSYVNGKRETHNPPGRALPFTVWDFYEVREHADESAWCVCVKCGNIPSRSKKKVSFQNLSRLERLLRPDAQPPGVLLHGVEPSLHPPGAVWQHGGS